MGSGPDVVDALLAEIAGHEPALVVDSARHHVTVPVNRARAQRPRAGDAVHLGIEVTGRDRIAPAQLLPDFHVGAAPRFQLEDPLDIGIHGGTIGADAHAFEYRGGEAVEAEHQEVEPGLHHPLGDFGGKARAVGVADEVGQPARLGVLDHVEQAVVEDECLAVERRPNLGAGRPFGDLIDDPPVQRHRHVTLHAGHYRVAAVRASQVAGGGRLDDHLRREVLEAQPRLEALQERRFRLAA